MFLAFPPMPVRAKRAEDGCSVFRAAARDCLFLTRAINAHRRRIHKLGPEIGVRACARGAICILSFAPVTVVSIRVNKLVENFRVFCCNVCNLL
jgi:hypothetical protein